MAPMKGDPAPIPMEQELQARLAWFIAMRWFAGIGIIAGTWIFSTFYLLELPGQALYSVGLAVLVYNLAFSLYFSRRDNAGSGVRRLVCVQIGFDWTALFFVVYLTGGSRSPVSVLLVFHLIIAAILLSRQASYLLAATASLILGLSAILEAASIIRPPVPAGATAPFLFSTLPLPVAWFGLTAFLLVATYLATAITVRLREREKALFESQQALDAAYRDTEALYHLGQAVNSTLDLEEVLGTIAENAARLLEMRACFIRLLDPTGTKLFIGAAFGLSEAYREKGPVEVGRSLVDLEALKGGAVRVLEVGEDPRFQYRLEARREGLRSMLCVPVQAKSRVLGVIRVYSSEPHEFTEQEENLLRNLANLGAVAIENARSYTELQNLNREKIWFARMTHHQLRSPLAAVQGVLDALPYAGPLTEKQSDLVGRARRRILDAFNTIRDFLDLAAAQRMPDATPPTPVDLASSLQEVLETIREGAKSKGIEFVVELAEGLRVALESADLERIFSNLLDNAVKYTPRGGAVRFEVTPHNGAVRAQVSDTGIGIAPGDLEHIFEGFFRTREARATGEIGTGLGLSIVKTLVDRIGAKLQISSTPGQGTCVTVILPAAEGQKRGECRTLEGEAERPD